MSTHDDHMREQMGLPPVHRPLSVDTVQRIVDDLAKLDPLRLTTFGHGSYGEVCAICGANDYNGGELVHHDACVWKRARDARSSRDFPFAKWYDDWRAGQDAELVRRSDFYNALWDVAWHFGPLWLSIRGGHTEYASIQAGGHEFIDRAGEDRFIEWAHMIRRRDAAADDPAPDSPEET